MTTIREEKKVFKELMDLDLGPNHKDRILEKRYTTWERTSPNYMVYISGNDDNGIPCLLSSYFRTPREALEDISEEHIVKINDVEYVRKDSVLPKTLADYYIVRTQSAGVFAGNITRRDGQEVEMSNARRLWYWDGAASLSQLALEGVKAPQRCKFPAALPVVILMQAIEIIPCTAEARKSIEGVKIWER